MEFGYAKFALKLNKILVVNVLMFSMILPINTLSSLGVSEALGLDLIVGLVFLANQFDRTETIKKMEESAVF